MIFAYSFLGILIILLFFEILKYFLYVKKNDAIKFKEITKYKFNLKGCRELENIIIPLFDNRLTEKEFLKIVETVLKINPWFEKYSIIQIVPTIWVLEGFRRFSQNDFVNAIEFDVFLEEKEME